MRRFYIPGEKVVVGKCYLLPIDETYHLKKVLRMKIGDSLEVFDDYGNVFKAIIKKFDNDEANIKVEKAITNRKNDGRKLIIAYALPKGKKTDLVIQKTTELGVNEIFLFVSDKSVVTLDEQKKQDRLKRWQKIIVESAKQCHRQTIPGVYWKKNIQDVLESFSKNMIVFIADKNGSRLSDLKKLEKNKKDILIIIGPEAGFSRKENEIIDCYDPIYLSLGENILRTETAAIAAIAILKCFLDKK
ncbi:RsmE family RNA methyltransferase [Chlamydiota bacterium]